MGGSGTPGQRRAGMWRAGMWRGLGLALLVLASAAGCTAAPRPESATQPTAQPTAQAPSGPRTALTPTWPAEPPARICGNRAVLDGGPVAPPDRAVVVPEGDNSSLRDLLATENRTFWFAPGVHTLGNEEYAQISAGSGSTYVGAPGAIIDGRGLNKYAFTGSGRQVTVRYLTIQNFVAPRDEGTVNHNDGVNWVVEYNTVRRNTGAGIMIGAPGNTYRYNCVQENGQYGFNGCCGSQEDPVRQIVVDHNEVVGNNTDDWEEREEGCGCAGGMKFWINQDVTLTNNWIHDNRGPGVWLDNNNSGFVIEDNLIENNDSMAIILEAGYDARIRDNNLRRNAIIQGRRFQDRGDPFPTGAVYISENGSPDGMALKSVPTVISHNNFENNWGGVEMWENSDRYCASSAHTHPPFCTVKVDLYDDAACRSGTKDVIPDTVGDKFRCRWSTENNVVEYNRFLIDKKEIGEGCQGEDFCGLNGLFANSGSYPEFAGYVIPWRITFNQRNVFRNNEYIGDWKFAGFEPAQPDSRRISWQAWTAPAPPVPTTFTHQNRPTTFGQDNGSTYRNQ